ncbi:flippase [Serratia fonticola]|uniref:flippase n=1 Tax=Serratia fonticola TaxID=47917 RepID=UPI003AAF6DEC
MYQRIIGYFRNPGAEEKKAALNTLWLVGERGITILFTLTVGILLARKLGPHDFGIYNYLISLVSLLTPLTALGLNAIVVRDLVDNRKEENLILGTSCFVRFIGASLATIIIVVIDIFFDVSRSNLTWLTVLAVANIFSCFQVIDFWLQSNIDSKQAAKLRLSVFITSSICKIIAIEVFHQGLNTILIIQTIEILLSGLGFWVLYISMGGKLASWKYNTKKAKNLLGRSWWLVLSGVAEIIYLKIDQIMLGNMASYSAVATYAVAARLSEVWYFFPTIITASFFPILIKAKSESEDIYRDKLLSLSTKLFSFAFVISILITFLSRPIIIFLYGDEYSLSASILVIHIWASVFVFMRAVLSKWLVIENLLAFSLLTHLMGAMLNIVLNLVLIPNYGGIGSAVATVISYSVSSYFSLFLFKKTRFMARIMTLAMYSSVFAIFRRKV